MNGIYIYGQPLQMLLILQYSIMSQIQYIQNGGFMEHKLKNMIYAMNKIIPKKYGFITQDVDRHENKKTIY